MLLLFVTWAVPAFAQDFHWHKMYGGTAPDGATCIRQTEDGGYILTGYTISFGAGDYDLWVVRTDPEGDTLWTRTYGTSDADMGMSVIQNSEGDFIVTGYTGMIFPGGSDGNVWLLKVGADGDPIWAREFGGAGADVGRAVIQTSDGGYMIAGYTGSMIGWPDCQMLLIKTDADGIEDWSDAYGAEPGKRAYAVHQTPDDGYLVAGVEGNSFAGHDVHMLRTDDVGSELWSRSFGGPADDWAWSLDTTSDGNYIVAAYAASFGAGGNDVWLMKMSADELSCDTLWTRLWGGTSDDNGYCARPTADGGYVVFAYTESYGAGGGDAWILKTDSEGYLQWERTYCWTERDWIFSGEETQTGYYVAAGETSQEEPNGDLYILKIGPPITHHVEYVWPEQNSFDSPVNPEVVVQFDTDMNPSTIDNSTLVVYGSITGPHSGTVQYQQVGDYATFVPDEDFFVGEVVTVVLTTEIETAEEIPLGRSFVYTFTTAAQHGSGVFFPDATYSGGERPTSVIAADMDDDGDADLVIGGGRYIYVQSNNGDGSFTTRWWNLVTNGDVRTVCGADLDKDGDIDVAAAIGSSGEDSVGVWLNNDDGTLTFGALYSMGYGPPWQILAADLDGDGDVDLATANEVHDSVGVFLNNGDGSFAPHSFFPAGDRPVSISAADLDNDGDLDLVASNNFGDDISVLLNDWDATFVKDADYALGSAPSLLFAADLDGDRNADVAVPNGALDDLSVLLNNGDATLAPEVRYAVGDGPIPVIAADLDGDHYPDLAVGNSFGNDISILLNNGDGTFVLDSNYPVEANPWAIAAADFNGDGTLDLAIANQSEPSVSVLLNVFFGDANGDGVINVADIVYSVNFLYRGGDPPDPIDSADANCDGVVNVADVVYLVNYLYRQGPAPGC